MATFIAAATAVPQLPPHSRPSCTRRGQVWSAELWCERRSTCANDAHEVVASRDCGAEPAVPWRCHLADERARHVEGLLVEGLDPVIHDAAVAHVLPSSAQLGSVLGSWGKPIRDAVRSKERWKGRRAPTQDPSTDLFFVCVQARRCWTLLPSSTRPSAPGLVVYSPEYHIWYSTKQLSTSGNSQNIWGVSFVFGTERVSSGNTRSVRKTNEIPHRF